MELSLGLGIFVKVKATKFVTVISFCERSFRVSGVCFYNGVLVAPGNTVF